MTLHKNTEGPGELLMKPALQEFDKQTLYEGRLASFSNTISFRSLDLSNDIAIIYDWVNQNYARRFWQMNGAKEKLIDTYIDILQNPFTHSFIGEFDNNPVCQVDLYCVAADELKNHVDALPNDCGLHLLMCPPKTAMKGLSLLMLKEFQNFYFSYSAHERLFAEPDINNSTANLLAKKAGFSFLNTVALSYKTANLYRITKTEFHATNQIP